MKCDPFVFKEVWNYLKNKSVNWEVTRIGYHYIVSKVLKKSKIVCYG